MYSQHLSKNFESGIKNIIIIIIIIIGKNSNNLSSMLCTFW